MQYSDYFVENQGVYVVAVEGSVQVEPLAAILREAWANPKYRSKLLWDLREASLAELTRAQLDQLALVSETENPHVARARSALLVAREVDYGVSRMFETVMDRLPVDVSVFRDYDAAMAWVAGDADP